MTLNISWLTSRKAPCFEWFISSLLRQLKGDFTDIQIIVVDYWLQEIPHHNWTTDDATKRRTAWQAMIPSGLQCVLTNPKPTPWQGPHRLTKNDYFAAANTRNTAICFAKDGHLAYVDDLSVLCSEWLQAVREACGANRITAGAFKKHKNLVVENGEAKSFDVYEPGMDSRWSHGRDYAIPCPPTWLFGCSLVAPVERFLEVNGWAEICDSGGLGLEDCSMGIAWANHGHQLWYDRRMLTYESEERHFQQPSMRRIDKKKDGTVTIPGYGTHPDEKGHHLVRVLSKAKRFTNYFEPGGIERLRQRILSGEPFPVILEPRHDWHDSQPLEQL